MYTSVQFLTEEKRCAKMVSRIGGKLRNAFRRGVAQSLLIKIHVEGGCGKEKRVKRMCGMEC